MTWRIMFILLIVSETSVITGIKNAFDDKDVLGIPANCFNIFSIIFSLTSFSFAQTCGVSGVRAYFPWSSRLLIGCSALLSLIIRVMSFLLYFTPCLGLMDLLRHFQAEQIGFYKTNKELATPTWIRNQYVPQIITDVTEELYINQNKSVNISQIQRGRWNSDGGILEYLPPKVQEYTFFSMREFFIIFWLILGLHYCTILVVKSF